MFSNSNPADEEVKQEAAAPQKQAAEEEVMIKRSMGDEENKGEEGKSRC